jgi:hypothetical protein
MKTMIVRGIHPIFSEKLKQAAREDGKERGRNNFRFSDYNGFREGSNLLSLLHHKIILNDQITIC